MGGRLAARGAEDEQALRKRLMAAVDMPLISHYTKLVEHERV